MIGFKVGERVLCRGRMATVVRTQRADSDIVCVALMGGGPVWRRATNLARITESEVETAEVLHPHHLTGDAEPL